ncbi:MAG TPA: hypothetical protein VEZ90_04340 [Blastocatellia bacterium]|nr:hypothetical protein [Blastocatellia bacterium]
MTSNKARIVVEEVTDPDENAAARARRARFDRNSDWLQSHATEVYTSHRGKCICVAGEELFVADSAEEVLAQARAAHPEDNGSILVRYIPREKIARIYAN